MSEETTNIKSGWKTSELWAGVVALIVLLVGFNVISVEQQNMLLEKAEYIVSAIAGAWAYFVKKRTDAKKG